MSTLPSLLLLPPAGAIPCFWLPEFELHEFGLNSLLAEEIATPLQRGAAIATFEPQQPSIPLFGMRQARKARIKWTPRCTHILVANATQCTNAELVQLIEAETGLRFSLDTVNTRRSLLGLDTAGRNQWTSPLRRWRPWQGGNLS